MIKLAHIAPIGCTQEAINQSSFNMVLAHIADESEEYCRLFKESDNETLLDNGAYELKHPMPADKMVELGYKVGAIYLYYLTSLIQIGREVGTQLKMKS